MDTSFLLLQAHVREYQIKMKQRSNTASFTVFMDIINNVVKDDFIVRSITKPGVEVHGYQPTPSDLVNASNAFVFIDNGFDLNYGLKNLFLI